MKCPICSTESFQDGSFCANCGWKFDTVTDENEVRKFKYLPNAHLLNNRYCINGVISAKSASFPYWTYKAWDREKNCQVTVREYFPASAERRMQDMVKLFGISDSFEKDRNALAEAAKKQVRNKPEQYFDCFLQNNTFYQVMDYDYGAKIGKNSDAPVIDSDPEPIPAVQASKKKGKLFGFFGILLALLVAGGILFAVAGQFFGNGGDNQEINSAENNTSEKEDRDDKSGSKEDGNQETQEGEDSGNKEGKGDSEENREPSPTPTPEIKRFEVTLDPAGGVFDDGSAVKTATVTQGEYYADAVAAIPTRVGYSFAGWYTEDEFVVDAATYVAIEANQTLYAQWIADSDVKFTVNYYLMDVSGKAYELTQTKTCGGEADAKEDIYPYILDMDGFTYYGANEGTAVGTPDAKKFVSELTIAPDGSSVVCLYYKREQYSVYTSWFPNKSEVSGYGKYYYGAEVKVKSSPNQGYEFVKWAGTGVKDSKSASYTFVMPAEDVYLEAEVVGKSFTVSFDSQGGSSVSSVKVTYDESYKLPAAPSKTGYNFAGWYTKESGGTKISSGDTVQITTDLKLYAHWNAGTGISYTINHYQMNVSGSGYTLYASESGSGKAEEKLTLSSFAKSYTGFEYEGACAGTKASETPGSYTTSSTVLPNGTRVINLYYTRKKYTVTLSKMTGIGLLTGGGQYYFGERVSIDCTLVEGYGWSNWSGTYNTQSQNYSFTMPASSVELTAYASELNFTLTFQANGGTTPYSTKTVQMGAQIGSLPLPTRDYYTFEGWFTEPDGGGLLGSTTKMGNKNVTVYAHWTANPESGWVPASELPSGALVTAEKWTYTKTETMESTNGSESGWEKTGEYWQRTGSGSVRYATFPNGFDTSNWFYQNFNKEPLAAYDDGYTKREVSNNWTAYIYWHWMYNVAYANNTQRAISHRKGTWNVNGGTSGGFAYSYFHAFESSVDCPYLDNYYCCSQNLPSYNCVSVMPDKSSLGTGTPRFFRFSSYTSSYTDYRKIFQYRKLTRGIESVTEVTNGGAISEVVKYVKYIEK